MIGPPVTNHPFSATFSIPQTTSTFPITNAQGNKMRFVPGASACLIEKRMDDEEFSTV
jgi:hypothetical protein